jgi:DNA invertase Pin-like site-specific DNA recombinase
VKVFAYIRVSKMDEGTTSPQRQRRAIEDWAGSRGATVLDTFEDLDVSAYRSRRRPGFEAMMARLDEVDVIVAMRLDRLARSVSGFSKLLEDCERHHVQVATCDGQVDTASASGRAVVQMRTIFAELESATLGERARQVHQWKREQGHWVGRVPYGFRLNGTDLEVFPPEFDVLAIAAKRYLAGESLRAISADVGISHGNLAKRLRSDHVLQALDVDVATALVAAMRERGRHGSRAARSLLGGIARCGICGKGLTIVGRHGGWAAYACKEGNHVAISQPWLDEFVSKAVIAAIDVERLLEVRARKPLALRSPELEARLEQLEKDYYELGAMPRERYLARREGLLRRLSEARKAEAENGVDLPVELAQHLGERWGTFAEETQRRIVRALVEAIVVAKASGHGRVDPARVKIEWRT